MDMHYEGGLLFKKFRRCCRRHSLTSISFFGYESLANSFVYLGLIKNIWSELIEIHCSIFNS